MAITEDNALGVFWLPAVFYVLECYLFPLKYLDLEYKKHIERRQIWWVLIVLGWLLIMIFPVR